MQQRRKNYIIDTINRDYMIKAADIAEHFNVSMETVRRDLEELEKLGSLKRVYGGAVLGTVYGYEPPYKNRQVVNLDQKRKIAEATCDLIKSGDTIFLDGGTTVFEVASVLSKTNKQLTIITNAIYIVLELIKNEGFDIILLGGSVTRGEELTTGYLCYNSISNFNVNKYIMGVAGITPKWGITDYSFDSSLIKKKKVEMADEVICVADFSKFDINAINIVCGVDEVDILVTDDKTSKEQISVYQNFGMKVIQAK